MSESSFTDRIQTQLRHDLPYAWFRWDQAKHSPLFRKQHLDRMNDRLEAYIDCYLISERGGYSIAETVKTDDWGGVFTVAYIALVTGNASAYINAVDAVEKQPQSRELSDALCRVPFETAQPYLLKIANHANPWVQVAAIQAVGHHYDTINPDWLNLQLNSETPQVRSAALRVIGDRGLTTHAEQVKDHLLHEEPSVRFQAAYSAALIGLEEGYAALLPFCFEDNPYLRKALGLVHHLHDIPEIRRVMPRIQSSDLSPRIKLYNIAMAGLTEWVPLLLEWMNDPEYAPLAAEAFCFITGADLDGDDLLERHPRICENRERPLAQKRKEDPWTQAYEEDLPWPDPEAVKTWWHTNRERFCPDTRYLAGLTLTEENLLRVVEEGTQPQRHQAELLLRLHSEDRSGSSCRVRG